MRIGLFGGTFDPVHMGHLDVARAAIAAVELDRVWLVPARTPPHRHRPHASAAHRFAMAALAVASDTRLEVSDIEMDTTGPSYTVDTLDRLEQQGLLAGHTLFFVIGADAFRDVSSWRAFPAILDRCHFVVVARPGEPVAGLRTVLPQLASRMIEAPCVVPPTPSIFLVEAPTAPVSSTGVRRVAAEGERLTGLVPAAVEAHIRRHGLYSNKTETPHG